MEYMIVNGELRHWGIKGMKWGQRRYQNKDGSLTPAGKKRYNQEVEETPEAKEAKRQQIIKTGSAKEVYKIKDTLSRQEQNDVKTRLQWEKEVRGFVDDEAKSKGPSRVEKAFATIGKIKDYAVKTAEIYNMGANVINAFSGKDSNPLPKIETNTTNGSKATKGADDKIVKTIEKNAEKIESAINKALVKQSNKTGSSVPKETVDTGRQVVAITTGEETAFPDGSSDR